MTVPTKEQMAEVAGLTKDEARIMAWDAVRALYLGAKHRPSDYRHIRAWGRLLGSGLHYVRDEQERAATANAPVDAIYEHHANDGSGPTGEWAVASDLPNDHDVFKLL